MTSSFFLPDYTFLKANPNPESHEERLLVTGTRILAIAPQRITASVTMERPPEKKRKLSVGSDCGTEADSSSQYRRDGKRFVKKGTLVLEGKERQRLIGVSAHLTCTFVGHSRSHRNLHRLCVCLELIEEKEKAKSALDGQELTEEERKNVRRAANRLSAFQSRQRRKAIIDELQLKVSQLSRANEEQRTLISKMQAQLDIASQENEALQAQIASAVLKQAPNHTAPPQLAFAGGQLPLAVAAPRPCTARNVEDLLRLLTVPSAGAPQPQQQLSSPPVLTGLLHQRNSQPSINQSTISEEDIRRILQLHAFQHSSHQ